MCRKKLGYTFQFQCWVLLFRCLWKQPNVSTFITAQNIPVSMHHLLFILTVLYSHLRNFVIQIFKDLHYTKTAHITYWWFINITLNLWWLIFIFLKSKKSELSGEKNAVKSKPSLSEGSLPHVSTLVSRVFFLQSAPPLTWIPAWRTQSTFPSMNRSFLKYGQVAVQLYVIRVLWAHWKCLLSTDYFLSCPLVEV